MSSICNDNEKGKNVNRRQRADKIEDLCQERGCSEKERKRHFEQYVKHGWNPHPPAAFMRWWNPTDNDPESGAHRGGHPDAMRLWARKDSDGWVRGGYGITSEQSWNIARYRQEFVDWQSLGNPEPAEEFVSIAATLERQLKFWKGIKPTLDKIGKRSWTKAEPVILWDGEPEPTTKDFQTHIEWLKRKGVNPPIIRKNTPDYRTWTDAA